MENNKNRSAIQTLLIVSLIIFLASMFLVGYYKENSGQIIIKGVKKVKNLVYYEATIHNPEGDFLPDWIDNAILGRIKELF